VSNRLYDQAVENIQIASEAFDTSLSFQEDAEVRRISEDLQRLSQQISKDRLDDVVREVRRLVGQGKSLYAQGDFSGADSTFRRAQAVWRTAFPTENEEVSFWLGLVRSAVDATTGRDIAVTDPLYKEMSQLYNLAYGDFQTGQELIRQDRRGEAQRVLDRAEDRLAKILVPFPYNAKARVLTLRILQIWDQDAFRARVTELYNNALALREDSPQEAYANLKDIEQLLPNYPGLQGAIADLEIRLGFRLPPPDPVDVAQAQELYDQARAIWDRGQREFYPDALQAVNRSIQLNPDNQAAGELKDRILIAIGEGIEIVPDDETRTLLAEAQKLVVAGDFIGALRIVEYLLEKPANRRNPRILDLEKLVRAKTGIEG
jgi:tetratricopeptide (TPR) repeat protein